MYGILDVLFILCPKILGNQYIGTNRKTDKYIGKQVDQRTCRSHCGKCMTSRKFSHYYNICSIKQQLQYPRTRSKEPQRSAVSSIMDRYTCPSHMTSSSSQKPPIVLLCKKRTDEVLHSPRCTYSSLPVSFFLLFALSSLILPIRFLIYLPCTFTVTHHGHFFHYLCPFQKITDCPHRDLRCLFHRIAVHPVLIDGNAIVLRPYCSPSFRQYS